MEGKLFDFFAQWGPLGVSCLFTWALSWWLLSKAMPAQAKQNNDTLEKLVATFKEQNSLFWQNHREDMTALHAAFEKRHSENREDHTAIRKDHETTRHELRNAINSLCLRTQVKGEEEKRKGT